MTVNRTPELLAQLHVWASEFTACIEQSSMRSIRGQWDIDGHDDPLTLFANAKGTFIVEPGEGPVPAGEWLQR